MLTIMALAFLSSFMFVFLRSWQQLNVVHKKYVWVIPTSMLMATCEVFTVYQAAHNGWGIIVLPIGIGGGIGCMISMYIHGRLHKRG